MLNLHEKPNITTDNSKGAHMEWLGARLAIISAIVGSGVFFLLDGIFLNKFDTLDSLQLPIIISILVWILYCIFITPFSAIGGYFLGWFIGRQWIYLSGWWTIISGISVGIVTVMVACCLGYLLPSCLPSHGMCEKDVIGWIESNIKLINGTYIFPHLLIIILSAAICGAWTGYRLIKLHP